MILSELLQLSRKSKNITLEQLAMTSGLSYGKVYRILNGDIKKPNPEALKNLADAMNLDCRYLFELSGYRSTDFVEEKVTSMLPILTWDYCYLAFPFMGPIESGLSDYQFPYPRHVEDGFVLKVDQKNNCLPFFTEGDLLICSPHDVPKHNDVVLYRLPTSDSFLYGIVNYINKEMTIMSLHQKLRNQRIYVEELLESPVVARLDMHLKSCLHH